MHTIKIAFYPQIRQEHLCLPQRVSELLGRVEQEQIKERALYENEVRVNRQGHSTKRPFS